MLNYESGHDIFYPTKTCQDLYSTIVSYPIKTHFSDGGSIWLTELLISRRQKNALPNFADFGSLECFTVHVPGASSPTPTTGDNPNSDRGLAN